MDPLDVADQLLAAMVFWCEQWQDAIAMAKRRTAPVQFTQRDADDVYFD